MHSSAASREEAQGVSQFDGGQRGSDGSCRPSGVSQWRPEELTFHSTCESCSPVHVDENRVRRQRQSPETRCAIGIFDDEETHISSLCLQAPRLGLDGTPLSNCVGLPNLVRDPQSGLPGLWFMEKVSQRLQRVVMSLPVGRVIQILPGDSLHNVVVPRTPVRLSLSTHSSPAFPFHYLHPEKLPPVDHLPFPGHCSFS